MFSKLAPSDGPKSYSRLVAALAAATAASISWVLLAGGGCHPFHTGKESFRLPFEAPRIGTNDPLWSSEAPLVAHEAPDPAAWLATASDDRPRCGEASPRDSNYEAPEPFAYLHGCSETGNDPVPESPDPLVSYTWEAVDDEEGIPLQIYRTFDPVKISTIPAGAAVVVHGKNDDDDDDPDDSQDDPEDSQDPSTTPRLIILENCTVVMDWGSERAAWFELILNDGLGAATVTASVSEYNRPYPGKTRPLTQHGSSTYRLETNDELYEGVRFTFLHVSFPEDASKQQQHHLAVDDFSLVSKIKPIDYFGSFRSSNKLLTKAWYWGAYSARLNMERNQLNSILIERGDRVAIQGDGHPTIATVLTVFGGVFEAERLVRTVLADTDNAHQHVVDDSIMAYPLYWCLSAMDYYWALGGSHDGDDPLLDNLIADIGLLLDKRIHDFLQPGLDITWFGWDDRVGNGWCYHGDDACTREGHLAFAGLVVTVCKDYTRLLESLAETNAQEGNASEAKRFRTLAETYREHAETMARALRSVPEFPSGFGVHAAANAINAGVATDEEIRTHWMGTGNDDSNNVLNNAVTICSFSQFNQYWILQAFGNMPDGMEHALKSIELCWGPMMELSTGGCFWELSSPEWLRFLREGDQAPHLPSYCHPWASGVTPWLSRTLGGIAPLVPGFGSFVAAPYVSVTHPSVRVRTGTPHGPVAVEAELAVPTGPRSEAERVFGFRATIEGPVSGYFGLRKKLAGATAILDLESIALNGRSLVNQLDGEVLATRYPGMHGSVRAGDCVFLKLEPGWKPSVVTAAYRQSPQLESTKDQEKAGGLLESDARSTTRRDLSGATWTTDYRTMDVSPFPIPRYPAVLPDEPLDRQSQGDGLLVYGADGYSLLGCDDVADRLPSYVKNVTVRQHGFPGWKVPKQRLVGYSDTDPVYLPVGKDDGKKRVLGTVGIDDQGGGDINCILVDVRVGDAHESTSSRVDPYYLSVYFVANRAGNRHAIRVMDGDTFDVIAPTKLIEDYQGGVWWTMKYDGSVRLKMMDIEGIHLSAIAFTRTRIPDTPSVSRKLVNTTAIFDSVVESYACPNGRPLIGADEEFGSLVESCIRYGSCPDGALVECWNTSQVTSMAYVFHYEFNGDISSWDVSSVTDMQRMFLEARSFNQPLDSWDVSAVTNMHSMFKAASSFNQPLDSWDVSGVTNMQRMFYHATSFNKPLDSWDVSAVTDIIEMFYGATSFNQPLDSWDLSAVIDIHSMFHGATSFNQPLNSWDVSSVSILSWMFREASSFNQPLDSWDVSSVTDMYRMFDGASSFNQPLDSWDVSAVTDIIEMFYGATSFNQPLGSWDVSAVIDIHYMFYGATSFNQPLNSWDVSSVSIMDSMFREASSFNQPLNLWDVSSVVNMNMMFRDAKSFNQCLWTWDTTKLDIYLNTYRMFKNSGCPNQEDPIDATYGPWCTDSAEACTTFSETNDANFDASGGSNNASGGSSHHQRGKPAWQPLFLLPLLLALSLLMDTEGTQPLARASPQQPAPEEQPASRKLLDPEVVANLVVESFACQNGHPLIGADEDFMVLVESCLDFQDCPDGAALECWNTSQVTSMEGAFSSRDDFNGDISSWDVSSVTDMNSMFFGASSFNQPLDSWNVSSVTDMLGVFFGARSFNQPLASWDVSSVNQMSYMFETASSFNQPLASWDVSSVFGMGAMFRNASSCNMPLASWSVSSVVIMYEMFNGATSFNQPLTSWDVSRVQEMNSMFESASSFNQPLDLWDVSSVTTTSKMFRGASSFDQPLSSWDVSSVTDMHAMFTNASSFNQPLALWDVSSVTNMYEMFRSARSFNQPLESWGVFNVTSPPIRMFANATSFNQCLWTWRTKIPTSNWGMFYGSGCPNQEDPYRPPNREDPEKLLGELGQWCTDSATTCVSEEEGPEPEQDKNTVSGGQGSNFDASGGSNNASGGGNNASGGGNNASGGSSHHQRGKLVWHPLFLLPLILALSLLMDTEGTHPLTSTSLQQQIPEEQLVSRKLLDAEAVANSVVESFACQNGHPLIGADEDFQSLVVLCIRDGNCPGGATLECWDTSQVTSMANAFFNELEFDGDISSWDVSSVTDMHAMFEGAESFNQPLDSWDVSAVIDMREMFQDASSFNQPLASWDVSSVTDMNRMFERASSFNQPLDLWDVSSVTATDRMFARAKSFNQPLESWDVSSVTDMHSMFAYASSFNQPLALWDVSSVTSMVSVFQYAESFNQPLESWDVSSVTDMRQMFEGAESFNQPLASLDVSAVTSMAAMFLEASFFNQPLDSWDVSAVAYMGAMFNYALSFNQPLASWDISSVTSMEVMFAYASSFNQPLESWDVSSVTDMHSMFDFASSFNQPLALWDVSSVRYTDRMFAIAKSFNQPLELWDVSSVTAMYRMFANTTSFNQCLWTWSTKLPFSTWEQRISNVAEDMFNGSGCPSQEDPRYTKDRRPRGPRGPWCTDSAATCTQCLDDEQCPVSGGRGSTPSWLGGAFAVLLALLAAPVFGG